MHKTRDNKQYGAKLKVCLTPRYKYHEKSPKYVSGNSRSFFQISQKYLALLQKFYSKTQKNSRSFEIATQISAILLNISHMAYIINGEY